MNYVHSQFQLAPGLTQICVWHRLKAHFKLPRAVEIQHPSLRPTVQRDRQRTSGGHKQRYM